MDLFWYEELNDFIEISLYDHDVGGKDDYMGRRVSFPFNLKRLLHHNFPFFCQLYECSDKFEILDVRGESGFKPDKAYNS